MSTHEHYTDSWWGRTVLLREEKCLEFVSEGGESSTVSGVWWKVVPDVRTEAGERLKAVSFAVEVSEFEYACV